MFRRRTLISHAALPHDSFPLEGEAYQVFF